MKRKNWGWEKKRESPQKKKGGKSNCEVMGMLTSLIVMIISQYITYQNINLYNLNILACICQLCSRKLNKIK